MDKYLDSTAERPFLADFCPSPSSVLGRFQPVEIGNNRPKAPAHGSDLAGRLHLVDTSLTLYTMQSSAKPVAFSGKDWRRNPGDG